MPPALKVFIQAWVINTLGVLVAAHLVTGIHYTTRTGLFVATLVLGILNAFVKPFLMILSLPLLLLTLGFFTIIINALLLYFVGQHVKDFQVDTFGAAVWGALIIGGTTVILNLLTGTGQTRVSVRRGGKDQDKGGGGGPVIDV